MESTQQITVEHNPGEWLGKVAARKDVSRIIRAPFDLYSTTGELLAFARPPSDSALTQRLSAILPTYKYGTGRRSGGMLSRSATFGFMPRDDLRHPCCRAAQLHLAHPEAATVLEDAAGSMAAELLKTNPKQHAAQLERVQSVHPRWRMRGDIYTSGIINYNNTLLYHRDRGNFSDSWNAMMVIKKNASGGELVLPEYDLAIEYGNGDCIWSNANEITHGVTHVLPQREDGYRISIVWYALQAMRRCGTPEEELAHARAFKRKTAVARTSAGRTPEEKAAIVAAAQRKTPSSDEEKAKVAAVTKPRPRKGSL